MQRWIPWSGALLCLVLCHVADARAPLNCSRASGAAGAEEEEEPQDVRLLSKEYIQPISFAFLLTLVVGTLLEKAQIRFLPESLIVITVGAALGSILQVFQAFPTHVLHDVSAPAVNLIFLPLIIFESGWSLRHKDFVAQLPTILVFAVLGSSIAILVVGSLIYATGEYHGIKDRRTAFTFASLISATDPVATLATYSSLKVDPLLNIVVFGESTINDAVAIVVFDIMNSDEIYGPPCTVVVADEWEMFAIISAGIAKKLFGSMGVGIFLAFVYTLILRVADMKHSTSMEILFIVTSCYFTYSTAEQVHMSGIIAVLFCSIFMGIYIKPHLSTEGLHLTTFFIKELAAWADTSIFLLVGIDFVVTTGASWHFTLWVMLFLLIGRACAVFPCGLLANCLKKAVAKCNSREPLLLSGRHLFMIWLAGLRGAIALVLCLEMGEWVDVRGGPGTKQTLINTTIAVIVVFLAIFGGATQPMLKCLGIQTGVDADERYLYDKSMMMCTQHVLRAIDTKVLSPLLVGSQDEQETLDNDSVDAPPQGQLDAHLGQRNTLRRGQTLFAGRSCAGARRRDLIAESDDDPDTESS
mmetsp:Transcript_16179/g.56514  ORF Transcript_16179/g.56514 Transcript_16179/m.56514 type:complete len:584 (-) Transcript_16179:14-1765(-)